jgi:formate hydrogenlyase transcriptional activator
VSRELHLEMATFHDARGMFASRVATSVDRSPDVLAVQWTSPCVFSGSELDQFDVADLPSLRASGLRSLCVVPLVARGGVLGTLHIGSRDDNRFRSGDVDLLRDIGRQVAIAVENTLAFREISELKNRLAAEKVYLESEITEQRDFKEIIGGSEALRRVLQHVETVAPTDSTVLLLGETGTGKELLARAIHGISHRRDRAFIRFNGAALPSDLVESELFGHERGAFTGATQSKPGRLELAHRGTFFLDEAGDVPLDVQPKLLRALQEREFERLGSSVTRRVDIRLIAATNRNLEAMVADGSFRSDLFYRLSVFPIEIPPLRDRPEDIPPLVHHFVRKFSRTLGRQISSIPQHTMTALERWPWPGNIRELQNVIERAVILSKGAALQLPAGAIRASVSPSTDLAGEGSAYRESERNVILNALRESNGIIAGPQGAAQRLGLKRTTLHSKMQKLGIRRQGF